MPWRRDGPDDWSGPIPGRFSHHNVQSCWGNNPPRIGAFTHFTRRFVSAKNYLNDRVGLRRQGKRAGFHLGFGGKTGSVTETNVTQKVKLYLDNAHSRVFAQSPLNLAAPRVTGYGGLQSGVAGSRWSLRSRADRPTPSRNIPSDSYAHNV